MTTHECDNCKDEVKNDMCWCETCCDEKMQEEYTKGYEEARKEFEVT